MKIAWGLFSKPNHLATVRLSLCARTRTARRGWSLLPVVFSIVSALPAGWQLRRAPHLSD